MDLYNFHEIPGTIRKLESSSSLYLTFDDGPEPQGTPEVLELLKRHGAKATFFVIAEKAQKNETLIKKILEDGHSIGNHSLDHTYSIFFKSAKSLQEWIEKSEHLLERLTGKSTVGFRSPNGITTRKLEQALVQLNMPLYLWSQRFYDTQIPWTEARAKKRLSRLSQGDIILLHDRQSPKNLALFLRTLDYFLSQAKMLGFNFDKL